MAECQCECWNNHKVRLDMLKSWQIKNCWCDRLKKSKSRIWETYGLLKINKVYSKHIGESKYQTSFAICDCVCWSQNIHVQISNLVSWWTKSCGCLRKAKTCWLSSKSRPYLTRKRMYSSCYNESHPSYKRRGARWIKVCSEWKTFKWWWSDNKHLYNDESYFTRKNVFDDFTKENCIWHTAYSASQFDLYNNS